MEQIELFDNEGNSSKPTPARNEPHPTNKLLQFKRTIFLVIYTILLLIVGFVIGVEHGRRTTGLAIKQEASAISQGTSTTRQPKVSAVKTAKPPAVQPMAKPVVVSGEYNIQVASLRTAATALAIRDSLKKSGFSAYTVKSQTITRVCVGPFKTRLEADAKLKILKNKYPDSFIK
jgi:cell division protein FtsN